MSGSGRGGFSRGGSGRGGYSQEMPYRGGRPGGDDGSRQGGVRGGYQGGRGGGHSDQNPLVDPSVVWENPVEVSNETLKFEDNWISENKGKRAEKGQLALRPAYGSKGKPIVVRANYFEMSLNPKVNFYSYIAKISPEPKAKRHLREIWKKILSDPEVVKVGAACDNATELVTLGHLGESPVINIQIPENGGDPKAYTVKLNLNGNGIIDHNEILKALANPKNMSPSDHEPIVVRALNILMAAYPGTKNDVITLGKANNNKFYWVSEDKQQSAKLDDALQCLRGYYASVRPGASSFFLNLSVNHSAFYKPGPLIDLWNALPPNYRQDRQLFSRYVRMLRVQCDHLKDPGEKEAVPRVKTIWSLADPDDGQNEPKPPSFKDMKGTTDQNRMENKRRAFGADAYSVMFYHREENQYKTVADYFQKQYKRKLQPGLPLLNVGNKAKPVYLPMDVLTIPPGQVFRGELNLTQRQNIIRFSCRQPPQNYLSIKNHGLVITGAKNDATMKLGMKIHKEMVAVPARILEAPKVLYRGKKALMKPGQWNLQNMQFTKSSYQVKKWAGVLIKTSRSRDPGTSSVQALQAFEREMAKLGMSVNGLVSGIKTVALNDNPREQLEQINTLISNIKAAQFDFVVIILPTGADRIFDHLKWRADTVDGVVIHCCNLDKITPTGKSADSQYFANNAMKINLRLGGVNQTIEMPQSSLIGAGNTMAVGLDVTHPSPTDPDKFPSIASIVASTDKSMGQWPGQVKIQTRRMENVEHLVEMMKARLQRWQKDNGKFPENLVIFRDGVSEGQYQMVLKDELPQVKKACELCKCRPNITVLVGGKRHNTRFFPTSKVDCDQRNNCKNGTVVDRVITRPFYWEFFLQAQAPLQGSARSAHYVVIHDEIFTNPKLNRENPADAVQQLTHNICYMMGRCTRSISYSTPAFLADRFADRARKYVRAYYYDQQVRHRNFDPPAPADGVTVLAERLRETMAYI